MCDFGVKVKRKEEILDNILKEVWFTRDHTPIGNCHMIKRNEETGYTYERVGPIMKSFNTENFLGCVLTDTDGEKYVGHLMYGRDAICDDKIVERINIQPNLMRLMKCIVIYNADNSVRTAFGFDGYSYDAIHELYKKLIDEVSSAHALRNYCKKHTYNTIFT